MQNSLERILVGMAESLTAEVLPQVEDPYARAQVVSAAELLLALVDRVEWRCADLAVSIERVSSVLDLAEGLVAPASELGIRIGSLRSERDMRATNQQLEERNAAHLSVLADLQDWLAEQHRDQGGPLQQLADAVDVLVNEVQNDEYALTRLTRLRVAQLTAVPPKDAP